VYAVGLAARPFVRTEKTSVELVPISVVSVVALIDSHVFVGGVAVQDNVPPPLFVIVSG
jgi:hypothetical protein